MKNLLIDYWHNFDRTYFGQKWGADLKASLEKSLEENECDHTHTFTNQFFRKRFISRLFQLWVKKYNCCDCEVLMNLSWRDGLHWKSEPEPFTVDYSKKIMKYKDGRVVDLRFYENGLKHGDILVLKNDKTIKSVDGETLRKFLPGEKFKVLMKDPSVGYYGRVQLVCLSKTNDDYNLLMYDDNNDIFNELEYMDSSHQKT